MKQFFLSVFAVLALMSTAKTQSVTQYVDPMIGTGAHGHTYPGATVPRGMVQLSPDTHRGDWDACSGYHYDDKTTYGFSHTHLSGTGCCDLGDILLRPTSAKVNLASEGDICAPAAFSHAKEKAAPGYYSVVLTDEKITAELTATTHCGMHRYTYASGKPAQVVIDLNHRLDPDEPIYTTFLEKTADNEIVGLRHSSGWVDNEYVYFVVKFNVPIASLDIISDHKVASNGAKVEGKNLQAVAGFGKARKVVAKVALSAVSIENARMNMEKEIPAFDFDATRAAADEQWNQVLSQFKVTSTDRTALRTFYTALYHTMIVPNQISDVNGDYRRENMQIARMPEGKHMYSTFSIWDTFRAWHPLFTLTDTKFVEDMIRSMLDMYDASGELPIWPLASGETKCMIGYHSVSVIADAYLKGIRGFDAKKALKAMVHSSEINEKGADYYIKYGYIPSNMRKESVSCLLEYAYDDWCIAQMAKDLGDMDVYERYITRSQNFVNVWDGYTGFFRGRRLDGNFEPNFDPFAVSRDLTEATPWQYRFFAPHDVNGLVNLFGGKEPFIKALDDLFVASSAFEGYQSDITGLIGQYAHGNEPSHHMAYLYAYVGEPWKTQYWTRRLLREMYTDKPDGISGNEDCGQMSAWYILTSLGLYSVCPGSGEFVLTTPQFDCVELTLSNGKVLKITANDAAHNEYIEKVTLNGKVIDKNFVRYEDLMEGGELAFTLCKEPNKSRGIDADTAPYSFSHGEKVSTPFVDHDLYMFENSTVVKLGCATPGARIFYTLDGTNPATSTTRMRYEGEFTLTESAVIKAVAMKRGMAMSETIKVLAQKAIYAPAVKAEAKTNGVNYTYFHGNFTLCKDVMAAKNPVKGGVMTEPSISNAEQLDHYGYIFTGVIEVPATGIYEFMTYTDDGSVLYIDDELVVNNDSGHAAIQATGRVALQKGYHNFRIVYFEDYEGEHFAWGWKVPGAEKFAAVPTSKLFVK